MSRKSALLMETNTSSQVPEPLKFDAADGIDTDDDWVRLLEFSDDEDMLTRSSDTSYETAFTLPLIQEILNETATVEEPETSETTTEGSQKPPRPPFQRLRGNQ